MRVGMSPAFRGTDLAKGRRVKISAAAANWTQGPTVVYADADDLNWIGVTEEAVVGEGPVTVNLRAQPLLVEAAGAFAVGALLFMAANGRVDDSGTVECGVGLEASGAAGDLVSMIPVSTSGIGV